MWAERLCVSGFVYAVLGCAELCFGSASILFAHPCCYPPFYLFDWWKWFLVDINTMEQFTVVKISTLSFIIHMCVSCFDFLSVSVWQTRALSHKLMHTCACVHAYGWVSARACVRIKALHTSKNQSHKLSPLRKWNIYIHRRNTEGAHGGRYRNAREKTKNASSNRSWKVNCKRKWERKKHAEQVTNK